VKTKGGSKRPERGAYAHKRGDSKKALVSCQRPGKAPPQPIGPEGKNALPKTLKATREREKGP